MKLLFVTQKVDKDDDFLGIYHRWIEKLSQKVEKITVICLYKGKVELPENVVVYSLGKETGASKLKYVANFYKYLFSLREYDKVFVHMNPEYILLGGLFWKILRKKIFFWYNHPKGTWRAKVAIAFANFVFHTSPFAFPSSYKKAKIMPVGVDTGLFRPMPEIAKRTNSILYLGRISPIKYIEVLIEAAILLDRQGRDFQLHIIGDTSRAEEMPYANKIKKLAEPLIKKNKAIFSDSVPNYKVPEIYNRHAVSVNLTPKGSFDKTIIEAMACESLIITSNPAVADILPDIVKFKENDVQDLARSISMVLDLPISEKVRIGKSLRERVLGRHDLDTLINKLLETLA